MSVGTERCFPEKSVSARYEYLFVVVNFSIYFVFFHLKGVYVKTYSTDSTRKKKTGACTSVLPYQFGPASTCDVKTDSSSSKIVVLVDLYIELNRSTRSDSSIIEYL